jgi:uncharacterized protein (TIGR03083 family)
VRITPDGYYVQFLEETLVLRGLLADGDLSAAVPGCPGWDVAQLGAHLGGIYRFAAAALVEHRAVDEPEGPRTRPEMLDWFDTGAASVSSALTSASWDARCLTMGLPNTHAFWARRMCHETMLHRFDAQAAQAVPEPIAPPWAADGVQEIVSMFFPRQVRLGRIPPLDYTAEIDLVDADTPALRIGGDGVTAPEPTATISGTAADILLLLWKRARISELAVTIDGDPLAARHVLSAALTP